MRDGDLVRRLCRDLYEYSEEEDRLEHEDGPCLSCKAFADAIESVRRDVLHRVDETVDAFVEKWQDGWAVVGIPQGSYPHDSLCDGIRELVANAVNHGGPIVNRNVK